MAFLSVCSSDEEVSGQTLITAFLIIGQTSFIYATDDGCELL